MLLPCTNPRSTVTRWGSNSARAPPSPKSSTAGSSWNPVWSNCRCGGRNRSAIGTRPRAGRWAWPVWGASPDPGGTAQEKRVTARELAVCWADVLDGAVAPTLTRDRIEELLTEQVEQLLAALRGTIGPEAGKYAAEALVAANYRDPAVTGRTIPLICADMARYVRATDPVAGDAVHDRALLVAAEFATGFTAALRSVALSEQEATLAAALAAAQDAERRRELSEARFEAVFAGASVGIGTVDTHGRVLEANAAFADMLGIAVEEMPGSPVA